MNTDLPRVSTVLVVVIVIAATGYFARLLRWGMSGGAVRPAATVSLCPAGPTGHERVNLAKHLCLSCHENVVTGERKVHDAGSRHVAFEFVRPATEDDPTSGHEPSIAARSS